MKTLNINLEVFQGPMELLCHLIEKNKIDIYNIPIVELTVQYLEYVNNFKNKDMDSMSEFIVMATTLLEIKSRMLLPKLKSKQDDTDPRQELINKLIEYKRFKQISELFKQNNLIAQRCLYKSPEQDIINLFNVKKKPNTSKLLNDITINELYKIFKDTQARKNLNKNVVQDEYNQVKREDYTISDKMEYIKNLLKLENSITFSQIFKQKCYKQEKVTGFIALLELVKLEEVTVRQNNIFDEIVITKN